MDSASSNQAETYILYQALLQALSLKVTKLTIIGDSYLLVSDLQKILLPDNLKLKTVLARIRSLLHKFEQYEAFDILRHNNTNTDLLANHRVRLAKADLVVNNSKNKCLIS